MRSKLIESSLAFFWGGTFAAGWFLTTGLVPAQAIASPASSIASSSEWKTTQTGEQNPSSSSAGPKPSAAQAKGSGSGAKQTSGKNGQKSKKTSKSKSFGNEVEKTFLGIGGDLEEFFTGKRTVDK